MADLSGRDRGQLLLVAALVLAALFVSLSVIVNTAIFSENVASQQDSSGTEALQGRHEAETMAADLLASANRKNNSNNATLGDGVRGGLDHTGGAVQLEQARRGSLTTMTLRTSQQNNGTIIYQNKSNALESADSTDSTPGDWTVVTDVNRRASGNGTRAFRLNLTQVSPRFTIKTVEYGPDAVSSDEWRMEVEPIGSVGSGNDVEIKVDPGVSGSDTCTKTLTENYVTIDVTGGTVAGTPCDALQGDGRFAHGVGDRYNISFEDGDQATGNYSLVTRNTTAWSQAETDTNGDFQLNHAGSGKSPYGRAAVYNTTVVYEHRSSKLVYVTNISVAPGEPDD